jgi:DNA gyrase subunit B
MNPEELWESTMDPDTRHLIQLKPENLEATLTLYDTIMGNSPKARKEFIIANAAKYRFFEEDSYDDFDGDE